MTRMVNGLGEMQTLVGEHLGWSPYTEITQEQVQQFAQATGDRQWIHIDVERATAGPFGAAEIRFPRPVPVGSNVRLGVTLVAVDDIPSGAQVTQEFVFECKGAAKPSCVAEVIFRYSV